MNKQKNNDQGVTPTEWQKPTFLQVFASVLSAIFGVQKNATRERDFAKGDPKQFIAVYIIIVLLIICSMILLVHTVLGQIGA